MNQELKRNRNELEQFHESCRGMSDDDIRAEMLTYKPDTPRHEYAKLVLAERASINDPIRKVVLDLADQVASMERLATTPAYKTWSFWLSVIAIVVAIVSWAK